MRFLDLITPTFTFGETVRLAKIDATALQNAVARDVFKIGVLHRTGRHLFSLEEVIQAAIAGCVWTTMRPPFAVAVAQSEPAKNRIAEIGGVDGEGEIKPAEFDPWYLVATTKVAADQFSVGLARFSELPKIIGTRFEPVTIVAIDDLARCITCAALDLYDRIGVRP